MTTKNKKELDRLDPQVWIGEYGEYLLRFAQARVGDQATAEDLAQETFLAAWNSRESFRGESSLKTWLTSILKHKILDHYRRHRAETSFSQLLAQHGEAEAEWILNEELFPSAWRDSPATAYEKKELYAAFLKCSHSLPSRMMEAFMFSEVDGLSGQQISERLDISNANARTLLHRAKKMLRACLEYIWSHWQKD